MGMIETRTGVGILDAIFCISGSFLLESVCFMKTFTTRQLAAYLQINEKKVYQLVGDGIVPFTRLGGKLLFVQEIIDQWLIETTHRRQTLSLAGSDDPLLRTFLDDYNSGEPATVFYAPVGSRNGFDLLLKSMADLACVHLPQSAQGITVSDWLSREALSRPVRVIHLFQREQGLILPPLKSKGIKSLEDLVQKKRRFINRNPGSGTRLLQTLLLEREGLSPKTFDSCPEAGSHLEVGLRILRGEADAGLGIRYMADLLGLTFHPLHQESFDLLIPKDLWDSPPVQTLRQRLHPEFFLRGFNRIAGYNFRETGVIVSR